jgi:hypothetical protein
VRLRLKARLRHVSDRSSSRDRGWIETASAGMSFPSSLSGEFRGGNSIWSRLKLYKFYCIDEVFISQFEIIIPASDNSAAVLVLLICFSPGCRLS